MTRCAGLGSSSSGHVPALFQGGLAAGSALWGLAVMLAGTESALFIAAALLVLPPLAGLRWRLAGLSRLDLHE
jgi:p-aminobenzoyl-glutamate transporter AbgT